MVQAIAVAARNPRLAALQRAMPPQRWRFVMHWASMGFDHGKAAEAARRAGYGASGSRVRAVELKGDPQVREAIEAIRDYCTETDIIDERFILNGLTKEALEAEEETSRIGAYIALAKIRRMGAFGGSAQAQGGPQLTQNVLILQGMGVDPASGRVSDASKFAESLTRAFGVEAAAGMLAQAGMAGAAASLTGAGSVVIEGEISPGAVDSEPGVHAEPGDIEVSS